MLKKITLAAAAMFACATAAAQEISPGMETGWMDLVKGQIDESVGAEVQDVSADPVSGERRVILRIPKEALEDESMMEEVTVIGQRPDSMDIEINLPEFETEWIDDYDNDYYGLLVRLKNGPETPIRLFFNAAGAGGAIDTTGLGGGVGSGAQP